jgi:hypothetical protein
VKWLGKVLDRLPGVRHLAADPPSTAGELAATKPAHDETLRKADRVLADYRRFDGALRMHVERKPR